MKYVGARVAEDGSFPVALLQELGANLVSITPRAWWDARMAAYLTDARQHGLAVLFCLDAEALSIPMATLTARYGQLVTHLSAVNEADDHGAESSYTDPGALSRILHDLRAAFPDAELIAGGFSTGQPDYVERVDLSPCNAIGIHPYTQLPDRAQDWSWVPGQSGSTVADLLENYRRFNLPVWADEIGIGGVTGVQQAAYCRAMLLALDALGVNGAVWFCGRDWDARRFGLLDVNGNRKPAFEVFGDAARTILGAPPAPAPAEPEYVIGEGLWAALRAKGWHPDSDELFGLSYVEAAEGWLIWEPHEGRAYAVKQRYIKAV